MSRSNAVRLSAHAPGFLPLAVVALAMAVAGVAWVLSTSSGSAVVSVSATEPVPPSIRATVTNDPVDVRTIIRDASQIVVGRVVVTQHGASNDKHTITVLGRDLLRKSMRDERIPIQFDPHFYPAVSADDQVLWFLVKHDGLSLPVGVYSGDFRVSGNLDDGLFVANGWGNDQLWSAPNVWSSPKEKEAVLDFLSSKLKLSSERANAIASYGDAVDPADLIPLDLVISLVHVTRTQP